MTQKDKDLLIQDLCARLPYGVKVQDTYYNSLKPAPIWLLDLHAQKVRLFADEGYQSIEYIKPYLFPLSSMTEKQKREYNFWKHEVPICRYEYGDVVEEIELYDSPESIEYLIENHFDYRRLIPKGIALDATGLNIY